MRTENETKNQIGVMRDTICTELRTPAEIPLRQWTYLKTLQAKIDALEWVLENQEVI
jgi:hypothetical protein